jgi:FxsC-like protein
VIGNAGTDVRGTYFFLSYAHPPPLAGALVADRPPDPPDESVRRFFDDLTEAVRSRAVQSAPAILGFFDEKIPPGADWKVVLSRALGSAQVFVPLYSPEYQSRSWPGREWECFQQRLTAARVTEPQSRFVPVLWIPLPSGRQLPGLHEAEELAPEEAAEPYRENGLRAMLRLAPYRSFYEMVVDRAAARIVRLAERTPIGPSWVPDIDDVDNPFDPAGSDVPVLTLVVAAPSLGDAPAGSDQEEYGPAGKDWRPFGAQQDLPLAEYARLVGEQFDFAVQVTGLEEAGDLLGHTPGVVLIDPWYLEVPGRREQFRTFARDWPRWALPLVIPDPGAAALADEVRDLLRGAQVPQSEPASRGLRGVGSLPDFFALMPFLVAQAEREYLRRGPIQRSTAPPGFRLTRFAGDDANPEKTDV